VGPCWAASKGCDGGNVIVAATMGVGIAGLWWSVAQRLVAAARSPDLAISDTYRCGQSMSIHLIPNPILLTPKHSTFGDKHLALPHGAPLRPGAEAANW
jgi:hypothetical protein